MDRLLTKKELAERWQVSEQTIDEYREKGIIKQVSKISSIRFNPQHIADIEETKLDRFSPIERKRLEREIEELKLRAERAESALARINMVVSEVVYLKAKEAV